MTHGEIADSEIVEAFREARPDAMDRLVEAYGGKVMQVCRSFLREPAEAADAWQEVFIRIFRAIGSFKGEARLFTWIYRIAVNTCKTRIKVWQRRFWHEPISTDTAVGLDGEEWTATVSDWSRNPERILQRRETMEMLKKAFDGLPRKYRIPVLLKDIQGMAYEDICQILDLNMGTVKSRIHRGRSMIVEKLGGYLKD